MRFDLFLIDKGIQTPISVTQTPVSELWRAELIAMSFIPYLFFVIDRNLLLFYNYEFILIYQLKIWGILFIVFDFISVFFFPFTLKILVPNNILLYLLYLEVHIKQYQNYNTSNTVNSKLLSKILYFFAILFECKIYL
jgi:hypothetical protein